MCSVDDARVGPSKEFRTRPQYRKAPPNSYDIQIAEYRSRLESLNLTELYRLKQFQATSGDMLWKETPPQELSTAGLFTPECF